jgi:hypothetical protein
MNNQNLIKNNSKFKCFLTLRGQQELLFILKRTGNCKLVYVNILDPVKPSIDMQALKSTIQKWHQSLFTV